MDIGTKLKDARVLAGLTQEQVAEELDVSRQTMSNWENGKTYPDIVSVIKMSDLYSVSLDHLLKDKAPQSDYIDYLAESTDTVKRNIKLSQIILIAVFVGIWAIALIVFWFFTSGSDGMAYSLMFLWLLLPVSTFTVSLLIAKNGFFGKLRCLSSPILGLFHMLAEYATFNLANMVAFSKFNLPRPEYFLAGAVISLLGLAVGTLVCRKNKT